jgi:6-pyruvoyltetrahydropterin/6-carboxytetrahydropterin synthase
MFTVIKRLEFCYGHRLLDYQGKCAHPHGHNAEVEIEISNPDLDAAGMVIDFGEISDRVCRFIEQELDHRMILRRDDPLLSWLKQQGEPVHVMEVNPTAENLAKLIWDRARLEGLAVRAVRFWETARSCAEYRPVPL